MAKKRKKRTKQEPEEIRYDIEVEDWEAAYHFGINTLSKDLIEGVYWENPKLTLTGKILSPITISYRNIDNSPYNSKVFKVIDARNILNSVVGLKVVFIDGFNAQ